MPEPKCEICLAIKDAITSQKLIWNKPLYETKSFFVLPSIGPLEDGHCMVVSKEHYLNLFSMNEDSIQEFLNIVDYAIKKLGDNVLFVEHGSFNQQTGGSCIEHTHIHIIPNMASLYNILDQMLPISNGIVDIKDLSKKTVVDFPYIFTFNPRNQIRLYKAYNACSQMMRAAICSKLNRTDWDWRQNYNIDKIKKSIQIWEKM